MKRTRVVVTLIDDDDTPTVEYTFWPKHMGLTIERDSIDVTDTSDGTDYRTYWAGPCHVLLAACGEGERLQRNAPIRTSGDSPNT